MTYGIVADTAATDYKERSLHLSGLTYAHPSACHIADHNQEKRCGVRFCMNYYQMRHCGQGAEEGT